MWAREYELIYIAKPDLPDEDMAKIVERSQKVITDRGGQVLALEDWGKKKLAYEIQKYGKGHFVYVLFLGDAEMVSKSERLLRIDDSILRFLTVKIADRVAVDERVAAQKERALFSSSRPSDDDELNADNSY